MMDAQSTRIDGKRSARKWFARTRVGGTAFGLLAACALLSLPVSREWYNVHNTELGIRRPPSFAPILDRGEYVKRDGEGDSSWFDRAAFQAVSWMGHDDLGRSLFYRVMPATLISLAIGLAAAGIAVVVGGLWGSIAALAGGRVDALMMRVVDVLYGLPYILMVILLFMIPWFVWRKGF